MYGWIGGGAAKEFVWLCFVNVEDRRLASCHKYFQKETKGNQNRLFALHHGGIQSMVPAQTKPTP